MKSYILTTDNKIISSKDTQNPNLIGKKFEVSISALSLEIELRKFFKWRKDCNYQRLKKLSSSDYDNFIIHLFKLNY